MSKTKPEKPSPDFPLFAHSSGKWGKRIAGKIHYFGRWEDPDGARDEYEAFLKKAAAKNDVPLTVTVEYALNLFLEAKRKASESGEISERTYLEHERTCSRFANFVGKKTSIYMLRSANFAEFKAERSKTLNLVSVGNEITRVRTAFKWLHANGYIKDPINMGTEFKKSSRRALRKHRREAGKKLFSKMDILLLLDEAGTHLRAMILLGINCGYGPTDCALLPISAIDLETGWADYPRSKTEVDRRCPLWPETVDALRASLEARNRKGLPLTADAKGRFFIDGRGKAWRNDQAQLSKCFTATCRRVLTDGGMYWLRHTFETIGGGAKDQIAVNAIMGHVDNSMAAVYREEIDPDRLLAVTNHVRSWLFADTAFRG